MRLKKVLIFIGILIGLFLIVSFIVAYRGYTNAKKAGKADVALKDYFPFGKNSFLKIGNNQDINENPDNNGGGQIEDNIPNKKLIKISDEPIAGYTFIKKESFGQELQNPAPIPTVTVTPRGVFTRELKYGSTGEDVLRLQQTLNDCPELGLSQTGPGSKGKETSLYVERTRDAVKKIQLKFKDEILTPQKLTEPTGILDELTRKKLSVAFECNMVVIDQNNPQVVLKDTIRYIEKTTGNIFDYDPETGVTERVTNTTIPRIQEAYFTDNGSKVIIRYLKEDNQTIETFLGKVPERRLGGDTTEGSLNGTFLQKNILNLSVSPDTKKIFYQVRSNTNALGTILAVDTDIRSGIFNSSFSEWLPQWSNENTIAMTTQASGFVQGFMYILNPKNSEFTNVFGNIFGLTTNLSPDGKKVLFSKSTDTGIVFGLHDLSSKKNYDLGITTLPEKCVWNKQNTYIYCGVPSFLPSGVYPDEWYQGIISTNDSIVAIDPTGLMESEELLSLDQDGISFEVVSIQISDNEQNLSFINRKDNILWLTKI